MKIQISAYGDQALLIRFDNRIHPQINDQVLSYETAIWELDLAGLVNTIPSYNSLTVIYDPLLISLEKLTNAIEKLSSQNDSQKGRIPALCKIPVCYEDEFAPDIEEVLEYSGLTREKLIGLHSQVRYRVYMLGFVPGFLYLGGLDKRLNCPRKDVPRLEVEAGSVAIGGNQTGIYPLNVPGGWQIIGRSPIKMFDINSPNPFPAKSGDHVQFFPISTQDFWQWKNR